MTTILAIHIGFERVHAAVEIDGSISLLALADNSAGMPIAEGISGSSPVVGGDSSDRSLLGASLTAGKDLFEQLSENGEVQVGNRSLSGDLVLAYLLAHTHARCIRVLDTVPDEVVVVRTAGGLEEAVYEAAARRALIGNVVLVEETRAWSAFAGYGPKNVNSEFKGALGALFWYRHGDTTTGPLSIVTREDLGDFQKDLRQPPLGPSVIAVGKRSVFDEALPSTDSRSWRLPLILIGLITVLGAVVGAFLVLRNDEAPVATVPVATVPVTTVPVTTVPVTTVPVTTVPVTTVPVTTVPVTTEETPGETTTTVPVFGPVTLTEIGFLLQATTDSQTPIEFGSETSVVLQTLIDVLGEPTVDTGWVFDERCEVDLVRRVRFVSLEVVFVDTDDSDGPPGFQSVFSEWFVDAIESSESKLWTLRRVGIGSRITDISLVHKEEFKLERAYPDSNDPAGYLRIEPFNLGKAIYGMTSNISEQGRILRLWAGKGCERRFAE